METRKNRFEPNIYELERRKKLIQDKMVKEDISLIIATAIQPLTSGYVRYISGFAVDFTYISPNSVFLLSNGETYIITTGNPNNPFSRQQPYILPPTIEPGVKYLMKDVYYPAVNFSIENECKLFENTIKHNNAKKVGLVGLANFSNVTMDYLRTSCPNVEFVDFTEEIDNIKCVKSDIEIEHIKQTIAMMDKIMQAVPSFLRGGIYEWELCTKLTKLANDLGSENPLIFITSGKQGTSILTAPSFYQNRKIETGDQIRVELRMTGPGGYFGNICRDYIFNTEPDDNFNETLKNAIEFQQQILSMIKPNINITILNTELNSFINNKNEKENSFECKIFGQGYDFIERPLFVDKETMNIKENMVMAIKVNVQTPKAEISIIDNFLIKERENIQLSSMPHKIVVK